MNEELERLDNSAHYSEAKISSIANLCIELKSIEELKDCALNAAELHQYNKYLCLLYCIDSILRLLKKEDISNVFRKKILDKLSEICLKRSFISSSPSNENLINKYNKLIVKWMEKKYLGEDFNELLKEEILKNDDEKKKVRRIKRKEEEEGKKKKEKQNKEEEDKKKKSKRKKEEQEKEKNRKRRMMRNEDEEENESHNQIMKIIESKEILKKAKIERMTLLKLPEDLLQSILSFLDPLLDCLSIARGNKFIYNFIKEKSKFLSWAKVNLAFEGRVILYGNVISMLKPCLHLIQDLNLSGAGEAPLWSNFLNEVLTSNIDFPRIRSINLSGTNASDIIAVKTITLCSNLKVLYLSHCQRITSGLMESLLINETGTGSLEFLSLRCCHILHSELLLNHKMSSINKAALATCNSLEAIDLSCHCGGKVVDAKVLEKVFLPFLNLKTVGLVGWKIKSNNRMIELSHLTDICFLEDSPFQTVFLGDFVISARDGDEKIFNQLFFRYQDKDDFYGKYSKNIICALDCNNNTPLHVAVENKRTNICIEIIKRATKDEYFKNMYVAKNHYSQTPLVIGLNNACYEIVILLKSCSTYNKRIEDLISLLLNVNRNLFVNNDLDFLLSEMSDSIKKKKSLIINHRDGIRLDNKYLIELLHKYLNNSNFITSYFASLSLGFLNYKYERAGILRTTLNDDFFYNRIRKELPEQVEVKILSLLSKNKEFFL